MEGRAVTIYICKCGRRVSKSTNADNTGNRDTENCKGCPYLLPWGPFEYVPGQGFVRNVRGYECRMSKDIEYATRFCGSIDDKCSCYIASLDFDFLTRVSNWIKETYPGGELNGSFFTDDIRAYVSNGRYRMSISCAQNKKGIAAKAALLHQFFDESGARLDMTPEEEKAHILAAIEAGKAKARKRKENMDYIISENLENDCVYAYTANEFWVYDKQACRWYTSGFCREQYEQAKLQCPSLTPEDFLEDDNDYNLLDDYELPRAALDALLEAVKGGKREAAPFENTNPTHAAPASPVDAGAATQSQSAAKPVSLETDECTENPTYSAAATAAAEETVADDVCPYLELIENSKKYSCQCSICGDRFVNTEICNKTFLSCGWYLDQQDKDALNHSEENTDKDNCLCRTCGSEECPGRGCSKECPNGSEGSCFTATCPGYIERTDIICKDKVTNAPSALGFDFGADESTNAELLQCAQTFVMGRVAQVMAAKKAHDITANHYQGSWGKWCQTVGISRDTGDNYVRVAENFGNIELNGKPIIEVTPISLLALGAKPSTPDVLTEGIGRGEITTIKQFRELEAQLKAVQTERDEARKAKEKAEQERDTARDAQAASSRLANMITNQRDEAQIRAEKAELRAKAAEEDAAEKDKRIRELETIRPQTIEATVVERIRMPEMAEEDAAELTTNLAASVTTVQRTFFMAAAAMAPQVKARCANTLWDTVNELATLLAASANPSYEEEEATPFD